MEDPYSSVSSSLQASFVDIATNLGWPSDVINQVSVQAGPGSISLNHHPDLTDTVQDLEYGNFGPPKAAFRKLKGSAGSDVVAATINDIVKQTFKDTGIV